MRGSRDRLICLVGSVLVSMTACASGMRTQVGSLHTASSLSRAPVPGAPARVTALVDVNVVPMDAERVLLNQTVLVEGGWITALGPVSQVRVPPGAKRIDGRGKYLLPGLTDMHVHVAFANQGTSAPYDSAAVEDRLFLWLANGITTVRNADYLAPEGYAAVVLTGTDLLRLRARAASGTFWSPWIYTSGPWAPTKTSQSPTPSLDSVAAHVAAYKAAGYDFLKIHDETFVLFDSVIAAAQRVDLPVMGHIPNAGRRERGGPKFSRFEGLRRALAGGMQSIEHLFGYRDAVLDWADSSGRCPPDVGSGKPRVRRWSSPPRPCDMEAMRALAAATQRAGTWNVPTLAHIDYALEQSQTRFDYRFIKALQEAGAGLLLGTDAPLINSGFNINLPRHGDPGKIHRELQAFVLAGLTPYQALAAGTRNAAVYFNTLDQTGTVAVGKRADLMLLAGSPLQDITHTAQPAGVMIGGRWMTRQEIDKRTARIFGKTAAE